MLTLLCFYPAFIFPHSWQFYLNNNSAFPISTHLVPSEVTYGLNLLAHDLDGWVMQCQWVALKQKLFQNLQGVAKPKAGNDGAMVFALFWRMRPSPPNQKWKLTVKDWGGRVLLISWSPFLSSFYGCCSFTSAQSVCLQWLSWFCENCTDCTLN